MSNEQVTVLVFKDNFTSRTFQVSLKWISQIGILFGLAAVISLTTSVLAIRYYRLSRQSGQGKVEELENQLVKLKTTNQELEQKLNTTPPPLPALPLGAVPAQPPVNPLAQVQPKTGDGKTVPGSQNPALSQQGPISPKGPTEIHTSELFSLLPILDSDLPDPATATIKISQPEIVWQGRVLKTRFSIQYSKGDGGNQQGRIIILARGPETLFGYPDGLFNPGPSEAVAQFEHGEYFSVSRFRAVEADFGPVEKKDAIQEVEAILLDQSGKVLLAQKLPMPGEKRSH